MKKNSLRSPQTCPHRVQGDEESANWHCRLAARIIADPNQNGCHVTDEVCRACCRHELPDGAALNPTVASIVYAAVAALQKHYPATSLAQVDLERTRQYAIRWLPTADDPTCHSLESDHTSADRIRVKHARCDAIGLVGPSIGFGLAHQNRDIARHLDIDRWLVYGPADQHLDRSQCRIDCMSRQMSDLELEAWLDGLDAVLFVERPHFLNLPRVAKQLGIRVILVPNWEWLNPGANWLTDVDLLIGPTECTYLLSLDWKRRYGFSWQTQLIRWPIDTDHFQFRLRHRCDRFVFVNGSGGMSATCLDSSGASIRRKALDEVVQAARLVPEIPIIVYADPAELIQPPQNVILRSLPESNWQLYAEGDVCIQPSHWEGLGLPLLECQAAGMPLVTVDAPPMNEYQPLAVVPVQTQPVRLNPELCIPAARFDPQDLAAVMRSTFRSRIRSHSRRARRFVEQHHSWKVVAPALEAALRDVTAAPTVPVAEQFAEGMTDAS